MDENWFYLDPTLPSDARRVGPLSRAKIEELSLQGTLKKQYLVWYPGLVTWLAWEVVAPDFPGNASEHQCKLCRVTKPEAAMLYKDSAWTCQSCQEGSKPEESSPVPQVTPEVPPSAPAVASDLYAPFGVRLAATLADLMLLGVANAILFLSYRYFFNIPTEVIEKSWMIKIPGFFLEACYQVYFLSQFGGTPGKMLLGLKVVTAEGGPLSVSHAIGRYFAFWLSALTLGAGFLMVIFDPQRRALHDHIAKTRVQFFRGQIR